MSVKRTLFPVGSKSAGQAQSGEDAKEQPDHFASGHAARAAEMPPFDPNLSGPLGGLFADPEEQDKHDILMPSGTEDLLPGMSEEALRAECEKRLCPGCADNGKAEEEIRLRALAELDNAKKRLVREAEEQKRLAAESVLTDILPSLDNLDLALSHADDHDVCRNFVMGVQMTRKLLWESLTKHGLEEVGAEGDVFDPAVHEAVGMVDSPDVPEGYVCALLSKGYKLKDKLLRPARVMVCKKS